jgi:predicted metal-dependent phosphoesterase TrpH
MQPHFRCISILPNGKGPEHQSGMLKVELHTHTADDPVDRIPHSTRQLIDRAAELGYAALAVTLHDHQLEPGSLRGYAAERGITLIPGVEMTVEGRHVLLLNFSQAVDGARSFADIARLKARERGLVVAPHPFFPTSTCLWGLLDRHAALFDAVEWNAMFTPHLNFNRRAAVWAARHGKPLVGNGDVHRLYQLGTCYSLVDAERDPDAICDAIRAGRVEVHADPLSFPRAALTAFDLYASEFGVKLGVARRQPGRAAIPARKRAPRSAALRSPTP